MSISKTNLLDLMNRVDPQNGAHNLCLLSLVILIEDGQSAPPTVHISNWVSSFRDFQKATLPQYKESDFWQSVYHLCAKQDMGTILGRHSVPIPIPNAPPTTMFLEKSIYFFICA